MLLYMPTKVYSEKDCIKKYGEELSSFGKKAMIVTGKHSSRKNGSLQDMENVLQELQISYIIFDEIEENPSVETVMEAREVGIQEQVEFVIGIGGGSPLDAAKAIALMIANPEEKEEVLYEAKVLKHLPIVCVPTTCGTGSEVTPYAILTLHKQRTKQSISHRIFPSLALLDAKYLTSMSREGLVNTAVDALAHLVESYLNTNSNELNRIYAREGLGMWQQFKENLLEDKVDEEDYVKMMHTSMVAGMAITHTGTSLPHGLSYSITYELGIPHGRAVGMFLSGYMDVYQKKEDVNQVLESLNFENTAAFRKFMKELLGIVKVEEELMKANAKRLLANKSKLKNYPFFITEQELEAMAILNME